MYQEMSLFRNKSHFDLKKMFECLVCSHVNSGPGERAYGSVFSTVGVFLLPNTSWQHCLPGDNERIRVNSCPRARQTEVSQSEEWPETKTKTYLSLKKKKSFSQS